MWHENITRKLRSLTSLKKLLTSSGNNVPKIGAGVGFGQPTINSLKLKLNHFSILDIFQEWNENATLMYTLEKLDPPWIFLFLCTLFYVTLGPWRTLLLQSNGNISRTIN